MSSGTPSHEVWLFVSGFDPRNCPSCSPSSPGLLPYVTSYETPYEILTDEQMDMFLVRGVLIQDPWVFAHNR